MSNLEELIKSSDKPVVAVFSASWCGPCKVFKPKVDELEGSRDDVSVVRVDIDEHPDLVQSYGVKSVPTTLGLVSGDEGFRVMGARGIDELNKLVDGLVS